MVRVTFAGACNRPEFFDWHIGSLREAAAGSVEFECIYVGAVPFPDELRGRFPELTYYRSPERVAACAAWALAQGTGDLLFHAIDDYEWEPELLARLVEAYDQADDYKLMPSPRYLVDEGGHEQDWTEYLRLIPNKPALAMLPLDGLISRRFYQELGGIDRRFRAVMQMVDVFARASLAGGRTVFPGGAIHERRRHYPPGYQSICDRHYYQGDRPLLESFYFQGGTYEPGGPRVVAVDAYSAAELAELGAQMVREVT